MKILETASNVELLNKLLENLIPEFGGGVENRNTYIEGGDLLRWEDVPFNPPKKVVLRKVSEREVKVWDAYKTLVASLSELNTEGEIN